MSPSPEDFHHARVLIAKALSVSIDLIGPETKMYEISVWDSLGMLSIVLAIEEALGIQVTNASTFDTLKSILGIAAYVSEHRLTGMPIRI